MVLQFMHKEAIGLLAKLERYSRGDLESHLLLFFSTSISIFWITDIDICIQKYLNLINLSSYGDLTSQEGMQ